MGIEVDLLTSFKTKAPDTLIIVPTHSQHETLGLALASIRRQTYRQFQVVVISDGATQSCLSIAREFERKDKRFSVLEKPKSLRKGEEYRDEAIRSSNCNFITYLCDDDIMLPEHLESLRGNLDNADFINAPPVFVSAEDEVWAIPTDLSLQSNRDWHLTKELQNSVGLSGVLHTRESYLSLKEGWTSTPEEFPWTDLYMWRKFIGNPLVRTKTSPRPTVVKFRGGPKLLWEDRVAQTKKWYSLASTRQGRAAWISLATRAQRVAAAEAHVALSALRTRISALEAELEKASTSEKSGGN